MANKKITQLNVNTNPTSGDVFPIVNSGETKQLSLSGLTSYLSQNFGQGFTGGTVTGTTTFSNGIITDTISATTYQNLPTIQFTGGTVDGLTANTISATTYQNLPISAADAGFSITARTSSSINANVILPPDCDVTYPTPLIMGGGYTLTIPSSTILTII